jgi:hypothetical protein
VRFTSRFSESGVRQEKLPLPALDSRFRGNDGKADMELMAEV